MVVKTCTKQLKKVDVFGKPINIAHKGKTKNSTRLGGFVTVALCILVGVYAAWRVILFS